MPRRRITPQEKYSDLFLSLSPWIWKVARSYVAPPFLIEEDLYQEAALAFLQYAHRLPRLNPHRETTDRDRTRYLKTVIAHRFISVARKEHRLKHLVLGQSSDDQLEPEGCIIDDGFDMAMTLQSLQSQMLKDPEAFEVFLLQQFGEEPSRSVIGNIAHWAKQLGWSQTRVFAARRRLKEMLRS